MANLTYEKLIIGKIMFKPTTTTIIMEIFINKIIMAKQTKNLKKLWKNNHD
jgi:hypothetical protein